MNFYLLNQYWIFIQFIFYKTYFAIGTGELEFK